MFSLSVYRDGDNKEYGIFNKSVALSLPAEREAGREVRVGWGS